VTVPLVYLIGLHRRPANTSQVLRPKLLIKRFMCAVAVAVCPPKANPCVSVLALIVLVACLQLRAVSVVWLPYRRHL